MKILIVEDERRLSDSLIQVLSDESYAADPAYDGATASELAEANDYDLVVLDLNIPPPTGLELLRTWRQAGSNVPILILTARDGVEDRVAGLDGGADDYLTKPFSFDEFLARVRSLLRRRSGSVISSYRAGDLEMDRASRQVEVAGQPIALSPKEFAMLEYLLMHKDETVTRTDLSEHVWDSSFDSMSNLVNVFVYRLRKKIDGEEDKKLIHTVPGHGYVLRSERS